MNHGLETSSSGIGLINYGIFTQCTGALTNYGLYSAVTDGLNNFAGYFAGKVHVAGQISSTNGTIVTSDQMFKTNVTELGNAMTLINNLQPRTFYYDTVTYADFSFESDQQMGLIAQEVEQVIPTIVSNHTRPAQYDSLGNQIAPEIAYKGVEYEELISLLIAGMQEQNATIISKDSIIDDLNERLTRLENCLSNILPALCHANQMAVQQTPEEVQEKLAHVIDVQLSDRNTVVLNQNVPNPFAESTTITYSVPETVHKAQIHFYDSNGTLINSVDIVERGEGKINVFANDLSSGVYTYSLVADGKIISTKRMMKQ